MSLKDSLQGARQALVAQAGSAMTGVAQVAANLGLSDASARAAGARTSLEKDAFKVIVVGRFKNGKSTFINALLGKPTVAVPQLPSGRGPMPTDDLPCTATLTSISYADKPYVRLWRFDGASETWDLGKYLREATVKGDEETTQRFFQDIREFEVGFPAELCKSGVTLLDSPGLDDVPHRTAVTTQAVRECDAAIVVYRHDVFAGQSERAFVDEHLHSTGTRVFTVVNLMNSREPDERLTGLVWNRLVKEGGRGPAYAGQDLSTQGIYYVNALAAEKGKLAGDANALAQSRMPAFEARLGDFLIRERHRVHFERWVVAADQVASSAQQQISQREAGLRQDQLQLQNAAERVKPRLAEIETRRDRLPALFARHRKSCIIALQQSFRQMVDKIRRDLPGLLEDEQLPKPGMSIKDPLGVKAHTEDATKFCNRIVATRFAEWGNDIAPRVAGESLNLLWDDVRSEVAQIEAAFNRLQFDLTGWEPPTAEAGKPSMADRVVSGVAGVILLNPVAAMGGATVGWRGALGAVGGTVAAKLVLVGLGLGASTIFLPAVILAAVVSSVLVGKIGIQKQVKGVVLKAILDGTDKNGKPLEKAQGGLSQLPDRLADKIADQAGESFDELETQISSAVAAEVAGEEESIRRVIEEGQRNAAEKANLLASLDDANRKLSGYRQTFKELLAEKTA